MDNQLKEGDWVRIYEEPKAFQIKWISDCGTLIGFVGGDMEPIHKLTKLSLNKYKISSYTISYWSKK
jgi:hypothetical protein